MVHEHPGDACGGCLAGTRAIQNDLSIARQVFDVLGDLFERDVERARYPARL
jgi:hypothetical protein